MKIKDIEKRKDLQLLTNSQDVKFIKKYLGNDIAQFDLECIDGFFVKEEDGDYIEIYGFSGCIPYLCKELYRLI